MQPTAKAPADNFTGDVFVDAICLPSESIGLTVAAVHFTPGARTVWHTHPTGQTLHCTGGQGLVGTRDGTTVLTPGRTIQVAPDEEHWHGAGPENFMTHIAIVQAPEAGPATVWGEPVTAEEYAVAPAAQEH